MTDTTLRLGPFVLQDQIGKGGMGTVWRGVHGTLNAQAAIKVVTATRARDPRALGAFRREVQAAAGLEHPGIISIFDYGQVTTEAADLSDGELVEGSPFLAMALSSGRTVRDLRSMNWPRLRTILLQVLDALAHAHARSVIHRDLKPDNVLVDEGDAGLGIRLTDFGIAHSMKNMQSPDEAGKTAGTPSYMAPEQLQALWRDYGPWTDLYSLGCMAFELATTKRPYIRDTTMAVVEAHIYAALPKLEAQFVVPPEFEAWVHQLMAKRPSERFRFAADAAWALMRMPEMVPGMDMEPGAAGERPSRPLLTMANLHGEAKQRMDSEPTGLFAGSTGSSPSGTSFGDAVSLSSMLSLKPVAVLEPTSPDRPPVSLSWRRPEPDRTTALVGAGLGLWGLRPVPFVDRQESRDLIWESLRRVTARQRAEVLVFRGEGGVGKRRLAEWMAERAHELGAAQILETRLGPTSTDADGLPFLAAHYLGVVGMDRTSMFGRLKQIFEDAQMPMKEKHILALTQVLSPHASDVGQPGGPPRVRFANPTVKHVLMRRVLDLATRERPVMLCVHDIQWGLETLDFISHLLEWQGSAPLPILVVLTATSEQLAGRAAEANQLFDLSSRDDVHMEDLGPLVQTDHRELIERLLHLEADLGQRVAERTNGNPLFAVQLVGDWVQRGLLNLTEQGFVLEGEADALPDDIHTVWNGRVAGLADEIGEPRDEVFEVLEIAAALGADVDPDLWAAACNHTTPVLTIPAGLVEQLFEEGLAERLHEGESGWRFAHALLRESLERSATAAGRWSIHQRRCAAVLRNRFDMEQPDLVERLARHLLQAGEGEEAVGLLLHAAREYVQIGDMSQADMVLDRREDALLAQDVPMSDGRWIEGWAVRAEVRLRDDAPEDALRAMEQAAAHVPAHDLAMQGRLMYLQGQAAWQLGEAQAAVQSLEQSLHIYHELGVSLPLARSLNAMGTVISTQGDDERAAMYFEEAMKLVTRTGDSAAEVGTSAESLAGLAGVCIRLGEVHRAEELFERAGSWFDHAGDRIGAAKCCHALATLSHARGDLESALQHQQQAVERLDEAGARRALVQAHTFAAELLGALGRDGEASAHHAAAAMLEQ